MSATPKKQGAARRFYGLVWTRRSWMGRAITLSVLLHVIVGVGSGSIILFRSFTKPPAQFVAEDPEQRLDPRKLEMSVKLNDYARSSARPRVQPRLVAQSPNANVQLPDIKFDTKVAVSKISRMSAVSGMPGVGMGMGGGLGDGLGGGGLGGGIGPKYAPPALKQRCTQQARNSRLMDSGGTPECETAVVNALRWFKKTQNADGSWGTQFEPAMTGLALLCFLGHCETPESTEFGTTVRKAISYLVDRGEGSFGLLAPSGNHLPYQHAIATYALAEAYSLTRIGRIPPVLEAAAKKIIAGQTPPGGWEYGYGGKHTDMSVTGWQIQALKAVHTSGLKVEGLEACLDKAIANLKDIQGRNGGWPYRAGGGGTWALAGAGVLGLQMWKHASHSSTQKGLSYIIENAPRDRSGRLQYETNCSLYGWYYNTLACFMKGGSTWNTWNRAFRAELLSNQSKEGNWRPEGGDQSAKYARADADIYRTALCTLMLEVYYRFLPATS